MEQAELLSPVTVRTSIAAQSSWIVVRGRAVTQRTRAAGASATGATRRHSSHSSNQQTLDCSKAWLEAHLQDVLTLHCTRTAAASLSTPPDPIPLPRALLPAKACRFALRSAK